MAGGRFVAMYRVSTGYQQRSGLGLEAQRDAVLIYLRDVGGDLVAEFVETVSGRKGDDERPQLAAAIVACRVHGARLVVSRLDRLSRDAAWLLGLEKRGVDFVVAASPHVNRLTIGVLALVAEQERRDVSVRTKQALAARRARGLPLGNPSNLSNQSTGRINGAQANRDKARSHAADLRAIVVELRASGAASLRQIASGLNARRIPTARGGEWSSVQVARMMTRMEV